MFVEIEYRNLHSQFLILISIIQFQNIYFEGFISKMNSANLILENNFGWLKDKLHLRGCINEEIEHLFLDLLWKVPISTIHRILDL